MSNAGIIVSPSNAQVFTNTLIGDMIIFTSSNSQRLLIGNNSNSIANLTLSSNASYFNSGNVGINTSNPAATLDITGTTIMRSNLTLSNTTGSVTLSNNGNTLYINNNLNSDGLTNNWIATNNINISSSQNAATSLSIASSNFNMWMSANIGDGSWNSITRNGDVGIFFSSNNAQNPSSSFIIAPWSTSNNGLKITGSGNVGINTATPAYPLDVNGQSRFTNVPIITAPVYTTWSTFTLYDNGGNVTTPSGAGQFYYFGWNTPTKYNWTSTTTGYMNSHAGQNVPYTGLYLINYNARISGVAQCDFFISKNTGIALTNFPPLADGLGGPSGGVSTTVFLNANTDYVSFGIYFLSFTTWYNVVSANATITLLQRTA